MREKLFVIGLGRSVDRCQEEFDDGWILSDIHQPNLEL